MSNPFATITYVFRAKLPLSSNFSSGPSGDTDYEEAFRKAIFDVKPVGFEVSWVTQHLWPIDREGMTWVICYCTDQKKAIESMNEKIQSLQKQIEHFRTIGRQLIE